MFGSSLVIFSSCPLAQASGNLSCYNLIFTRSLGDKAGGLLAGLLSLITNADSGGLTGFISKFTGAGLGNVVSSWISQGENTALTNGQLSSVLGNETIENLADKAGLSPALAMPALAYMLPKVVDRLTPDGVVPTSLPNTIMNYISGLGGMLGKGVGTQLQERLVT